VTRVLERHQLLLYEPVLHELAVKCEKEKFRPYFTRTEGELFVRLLEQVGELVAIRGRIGLIDGLKP
jgi:hypothetical protein